MNSEVFSIGDWVEVRSLEEIILTLDDTNSLADLPFMPEMVKYCGRRFRIMKSAHKTCDPSGRSKLRRMENAVHLDTRCDGSGHDGCEARCLIFWKTDWLKKVEGDNNAEPPAAAPQDIERLQRTTKVDAERYRCQLTHLPDATTKLPLWNVGHYFKDLTTHNISFKLLFTTVPKTFLNEFYTRIIAPLPRAIKRSMAKSSETSKTAGILNLQPNELVQEQEILATLDKKQKYRGMRFELEMFRYCGKTFRVSHRMTKAISEHTGKMLRFKKDGVVLDGVACRGLDSVMRLFCQRAALYYWREAWLQRASDASHSACSQTSSDDQKSAQSLEHSA
ncbi:MAG: hypothetical protein P8Y36_11805 [Alphaproteobacteria bacterium]